MYAPPRLKFIQRQRQGLQDIDSAPVVSSGTAPIDVRLLGMQEQLAVVHLQKLRRRSWMPRLCRSVKLNKKMFWSVWVHNSSAKLDRCPSTMKCPSLSSNNPSLETWWLLTCSYNIYVFRFAWVFSYGARTAVRNVKPLWVDEWQPLCYWKAVVLTPGVACEM